MNYEDFQVGICDAIDNSSAARKIAAAADLMPTSRELLTAIVLTGIDYPLKAGETMKGSVATAVQWADEIIRQCAADDDDELVDLDHPPGRDGDS